MKKLTLFIVVIAIITCSQVNAAIITVDNKTPSIGNYTTLQAAHDAASNGDTIYVYPSEVSYDGITVTKSLAFVGTGFDYPSVERINRTLLAGMMTFGTGSDGSKLEGFGGYGIGSGFHVIVDANNIMIKRNLICTITVKENHTGTVILQNDVSERGNCDTIIVMSSNEVLIVNNKITNINPNSCGSAVKATNSTTITLLHNVISGGGKAIYTDTPNKLNKFIANNIIVGGICNDTSSGYYYNMSNSNQLPEGNGNITNVDMGSVFVDPDNYDFHLLPDSPAIGAGHNGADMGIYGGSTPFVDGGVPGLPSIYYLQLDHMGTQETGLDVTIKARSNME